MHRCRARSLAVCGCIRAVRAIVLGFGLLLPMAGAWAGDEVVRVASFNIRNYLCMDRRLEGTFRPGYPKPEAEKAAVRAVIREVDADVVCLQEIGPQPFLDELQHDLEREGTSYPHAVLLDGADPLRHIAVLSRLPFAAVVSHSDIDFDYLDRREVLKRGMLEVQFGSDDAAWRVFVLHLKSPLTEDRADPQAEERRVREARAARDRILERTRGEPGARYLIVGDLNAAPDARALRGLLRRGTIEVARLVPTADSRGETWTHLQARSERYERVDYLLPSPALVPAIRSGRAHVHDGPDALVGSDHRLLWIEIAVAGEAGAPTDKTKTPAGAGPAGVSAR